MSFEFGTTGVKSRDFKVYVRDASIWQWIPTPGTLPGAWIIDTTYYAGNTVSIEEGGVTNCYMALSEHYSSDTNKPEFIKVGQCLKEGIGVTVEEGDSTMLNEAGQASVDLNCTATFTLANITKDNVDFFSALDGKSLDVVFVETGDSPSFFIWIKSVMYNYQENFQSGEVQTLPVELNKTVPTMTEFRVYSATQTMILPNN